MWNFNFAYWIDYVKKKILLFFEILYVMVRMGVAVLEPIAGWVVRREKSLVGEIALVTGSGHGIGQKLAIKLASEGCIVIGWDKNERGNDETIRLMREKGFEGHFYACDVTNREEVLSLARRVEEEVGPVSLLINNAGIMICKPMTEQTSANIETVIKVNLLAHFWTIEAFLPKMKARKHGHLVAICSACGLVGLPNAVPYSAAKFGLRGFMETLREELRVTESDSPIKITTVNPIAVDTGLAKRPRNRFPSFIGVLTVDEVTNAVLKAIKREYREISVPRHFAYTDYFMRGLPAEAYQILRDFLDTGVDPE